MVGQSDIDALRTQLLSDIISQNQEQLTRQLPEGVVFLGDALQSNIAKETISNKVGDEVETFSIELSVTTQGLSIRKQDLEDMVNKTKATSIP